MILLLKWLLFSKDPRRPIKVTQLVFSTFIMNCSYWILWIPLLASEINFNDNGTLGKLLETSDFFRCEGNYANIFVPPEWPLKAELIHFNTSYLFILTMQAKMRECSGAKKKVEKYRKTLMTKGFVLYQNCKRLRKWGKISKCCILFKIGMLIRVKKMKFYLKLC